MVSRVLPLSNVSDCNDVQLRITLELKTVIDAGILMEVRPDDSKALEPIVLNWLPPFENVTFLKDVQSSKQESPIVVTVTGIVSNPDAGTMLQLSATHVCPLPASVYGVAAAHSEHPLVPPLEVPE